MRIVTRLLTKMWHAVTWWQVIQGAHPKNIRCTEVVFGGRDPGDDYGDVSDVTHDSTSLCCSRRQLLRLVHTSRGASCGGAGQGHTIWMRTPCWLSSMVC